MSALDPLSPPKPPGLINGALQATAVSPTSTALAPSPSYSFGSFSSGARDNLAKIGLTEDDVSTQRRVHSLVSEPSALLRQSQDATDAAFNKRGLLNSSAAVQAGHDALLGRALDIVNPEIDRVFTTAKGNADNAAALERAKAEQAAAAQRQAAEAAAAAARQQADLSAAASRQQSDISATAQRDAANNQAAAERERIRLETEARLRAEDQARADARSDKENTAADRRAQEAADRTLQANYRNETQGIYDKYLADVQSVQGADMDPAAKTAHIQNLNAAYTSRMQYTNKLYSTSQGWRSEWSLVSVSFGLVSAPRAPAPSPATPPAPPAPIVGPLPNGPAAPPAPALREASSFTGQEIREYLSANGLSNNAEGIYQAAKSFGVKAPQLDAAMGWAPGTAADWIRQKQLAPL